MGKTKPFKCVWNCLSPCNFREAPYCIAQVLFNAAEGKMAEGFAFAGANAYKASKIEHVSDVFNDLVMGYNAESILKQTIETNELEAKLLHAQTVSS